MSHFVETFVYRKAQQDYAIKNRIYNRAPYHVDYFLSFNLPDLLVFFWLHFNKKLFLRSFLNSMHLYFNFFNNIVEIFFITFIYYNK